MPAQAGIQILFRLFLDASLRWHDKEKKGSPQNNSREIYPAYAFTSLIPLQQIIFCFVQTLRKTI